MSIDSYADSVLVRLQRMGLNLWSDMETHTLIAHCHMKGVSVAKAAKDIAKRHGK